MTVDPHISGLVAAEPIPDHLPGFWDRFDAELATVAGTSSESAELAALADGADLADVHVLPLTTTDDDSKAVAGERAGGWSLVLVAAALLLIVGAVGALFASRASEDATTIATEPSDRGPVEELIDEIRAADTTPIFSVSTSPQGHRQTYWRITTLDEFFGQTWTSQGRVDPIVVQEPLEPDRLTADATTHTVTVLGEIGPFLPYPQQFSTVAAEDTELRWANENGLRLSGGISRVPEGFEYTIQVVPGIVGPTSYLPDGVSFEDFMAESQAEEDLAELTRVPSNFPDSIRELARDVTAGHESDFDKALALQDFFRTEFVHDVAAQNSEDDAMVAFLDRRAGGVEDFAGTFAAMMRSIGVPARVVVGFAGGDIDPVDQGRLIVTGEHGHAWPEVLVEQAGLKRWVEFEPMPQRELQAVAPFANVDHWHAIYAVYDCMTDGYLPGFRSDRDEYGIHSHNDGLIHIHPWTDSVAGRNATFDVFLETMGAEVDGSGIRAADDGIDLGVPETCLGGEPVVHLRKWSSVELVGGAEPEVITTDIGGVRFVNDREVYVLAIAPVDAELPDLPADRFALLDSVTPIGIGEDTSSISPVLPADAEDVPIFVFAEGEETFASIARTYLSTVDALRAANPGIEEPLAGKTIFVPRN